jgi:hypothetical protein
MTLPPFFYKIISSHVFLQNSGLSLSPPFCEAKPKVSVHPLSMYRHISLHDIQFRPPTALPALF